jgi:hypothetical protein
MADLQAAWAVLETEASLAGAPLKGTGTGHLIGGREVEIAADAAGVRYLLIPLVPGEAVLEDRSGRWVQLVRTTVEGRSYVALTCGAARLTRLFHLLAEDILREIEGKSSAAAVAFQALQRWKELFAAASGPLGDAQLIGLLAELLCLERCYECNPTFDLSRWTGPRGGKHDFQGGTIGVEVKATETREGRVIGVNGIEQLDPSPGTHLYLAYHRLEAAEPGVGHHLPGVIDRLEAVGTPRGDLLALLERIGYSAAHDENYVSRAFKVVDFRLYDAMTDSFPRLVRTSFQNSHLPAGVLRVRYSIDLTNEPPTPLDSADAAAVWGRLAGGFDGTA